MNETSLELPFWQISAAMPATGHALQRILPQRSSGRMAKFLIEESL